MKDLTRRQFLQTVGIAGGAVAVPTAAEAAKSDPEQPSLHTEGAEVGLSVCPYCAVGLSARAPSLPERVSIAST